VQIRVWRWRTPLRSAVSFGLTNLLQAFRRRRVKADPAAGRWGCYLPLFTGCHLVMRRKVNGEWQYRLPTPEEEADYVASEIW
jgi:hypothetical protein